MIPLLIICIIRNFRFRGNRKYSCVWLADRMRYYTFRIIAIGGILLLFSVILKAQTRQASYNIIRNGDIAGHLNFQQIIKGDSVVLKAESEVKARFLFTITVLAKEEAIYKSGILLYSSIYRKTNGSEKTNRQMRLSGNEYHVTSSEKKEVLINYPIRYSMLNLYCCEPTFITNIYSDKFQQYVPVEKVAEGKYKVSLPDGNYNYYYYKKGVCVVVDVHASLYSAVLVLNR